MLQFAIRQQLRYELNEYTLYEYRSVLGSHAMRSWALNFSSRTGSESRGVLVTMAMSCSRIGFGVD